MSDAIRAWRFGFRPLDERGHEAGLSLTAHGGIELLSEAQAVRQAILLLVSTRPGERVMRPEYGCYLFRLAFAPNDDTTAGLAIHYVRAALDRWEPRIVVLRLDAERNDQHKSRLDLHLQYRLRSHSDREQMQLSFDLLGGRMT